MSSFRTFPNDRLRDPGPCAFVVLSSASTRMAASRTSVRGRAMSRRAMFSCRYVFRPKEGRTNRMRVRSFFRLLRTSWTISSREPRGDPFAYPRTLSISFSAIRWIPSPSVSPALSSKDIRPPRRPTWRAIRTSLPRDKTVQARIRREGRPRPDGVGQASQRLMERITESLSRARLLLRSTSGTVRSSNQGEGQAMKDDLEMDGPGRTSREGSVRDVMTPLPRAVDTSASVMDAAEIMRDANIGDVVVLDSGVLYGILTDRDIVVRVLAEGDDPATVPVGQVCSRELTTIPSTASVGDAVRLIREKAIRRLPVVEEGGEVVGILSMGDIAVARDPKSALGDLSAAPPNT